MGAAAGFSPTTLWLEQGRTMYIRTQNGWPKLGNNPNNPPFIAEGVRRFFRFFIRAASNHSEYSFRET